MDPAMRLWGMVVAWGDTMAENGVMGITGGSSLMPYVEDSRPRGAGVEEASVIMMEMGGGEGERTGAKPVGWSAGGAVGIITGSIGTGLLNAG